MVFGCAVLTTSYELAKIAKLTAVVRGLGRVVEMKMGVGSTTLSDSPDQPSVGDDGAGRRQGTIATQELRTNSTYYA
eukprot:3970710-Pleurochrysis_carterae.AAC.2